MLGRSVMVIAIIGAAGAATFRLDDTVSPPYDTPERYADPWRIIAPESVTR